MLYGKKEQLLFYYPFEGRVGLALTLYLEQYRCWAFQRMKGVDPDLPLYPTVLSGRMLQNRDNAELFYKRQSEEIYESWRVKRRGVRCDKNDGLG